MNFLVDCDQLEGKNLNHLENGPNNNQQPFTICSANFHKKYMPIVIALIGCK